MVKMLVVALSASAVFAGVVMTAQDRTAFPGQPTPARVWIQNQGEMEAVPVQVTGRPTVLLADDAVVRVRELAQAWDYQTVAIPSNQDPVPLLNAAGANGWEATGIALPAPNGALVVLKRPRP
jgi:hypothetical protein